MLEKIARCARLLSWTVIRHRVLLSAGIGVAAWIVLRSIFVIPVRDPMLRYIAFERPALYRAFVSSFVLLLFTTPFLVLSLLFSLLYVHFYRDETEQAGTLPPFPPVANRRTLFLILGEIHRQLEPFPARQPHWLTIPERGLYTGIAAIGATGSGKTQAFIIPAMRQLFGYKASDPKEKLSGLVLEVKGDLCRHLSGILKEHGRDQDFVEVNLDSNIRYNPLNNDLDPYAQAFNIASIITAIWGKGKRIVPRQDLAFISCFNRSSP